MNKDPLFFVLTSLAFIVPSFGYDFDFEIETPDGFIRKKYQVKNDFSPRGSIYESSESYHESKGYKKDPKESEHLELYGYTHDEDAPKIFERIYNEAKYDKPKEAQREKSKKKTSKPGKKSHYKKPKSAKPKLAQQAQELDYFSVPFGGFDFENSGGAHSAPIKFYGHDDDDGFFEHTGHNYEKSYSRSYGY